MTIFFALDIKVEAKRAVPRSEVPKETPASSPGATAPTKHVTAAAPAKPSYSSIPESKFSGDDLAFNKIFVGGLHYDTRDGEYNISNSPDNIY